MQTFNHSNHNSGVDAKFIICDYLYENPQNHPTFTLTHAANIEINTYTISVSS